VIGLQSSSRDVDIKAVLSFEVSPIHTALFTDSAEMRISKSKSVLKNATKIEVSARQVTQDSTCTVIDGCALIWIPHWQVSNPTKQPTVIDFVNKLMTSDVYLVFNRYTDF